MPSRGLAEHWIRLMQSLGVQSSLAHSVGVQFSDYKNKSHIISWDLERVSQASATGTSTQGMEIRIDVKGLQDAAATQMSRCYIVQHYDCIFELRAGAINKLY